LKKTEIFPNVHEVDLFPLCYISYNTVTSVKEKLVSQIHDFMYEKKNQTFEVSAIEFLNIQGTLKASL
jgi:hypothetical protein